MNDGAKSFSREGHIAWAFIAVFFATLVATVIASSGPFLQTCAGCGSTVEGTLCYGTASGGCAATDAFDVALGTVMSGLCLLFAIHASVAYRLKRGLAVSSLLQPQGRSARRLIQVGSLTVMSEGALFALVGLLIPWFALENCHEGCPPPYVLNGTPLNLTLLGGVALLVAASLFLAGVRRSGSARGLAE
jgi:hypothetical protein